MFVPNFKILGAVVLKKSLTRKKKFTYRHTEAQTDKHCYKKDKNYIPLYMYPPILRVHLKKQSAKNLSNYAYAMFCGVFFCCCFFFLLHMLWVSLAIQMDTHNICLYKEVDKKYTGCNLKPTELHYCALTGVCAIIRSNIVFPLSVSL